MRLIDLPIPQELQTVWKLNRTICPVTAMEGRGMKTYDFEARLAGSLVTCAVRASESPSDAVDLIESYFERLATERGLDLVRDFLDRVAAAISLGTRSSGVSLGEVARPAT